jgi:hypothetical protein
MKSYKTGLIIDSLVKLGVVAALIIAATTKQEYSYYTFLRWLVMTTSIYFAYKTFDKKQIGHVIYFVATGILFNPFQKFWFQKDTWHLIDYIVAGITTATIIFDWVQKSKYDRTSEE